MKGTKGISWIERASHWLRRAGVLGLLLGLSWNVALRAQAAPDESEEVDRSQTAGAGLVLTDQAEEIRSQDQEIDELPASLTSAPPPLEPVGVSRITFDVPFSAAGGGGSARGSAGNMEYLGQDQIVASEAVEFSYQNVRIQAHRMTVDLESKEVVAEGNVILDEGPSRLSGSRLVYDLENRSGKIFEANAFVDPDLFMTGAEISKESDTIFSITDGTITSCSEDLVPDWSFRLGQARVNTEGFARVKNATLRFKKLPVFYAPFMVFPARSERTSGFLFPHVGYSDARGALLGLAWYQTLGRSYDATIYADVYGEDFLGLGAEFRYSPSQGTNGIFQGFVIDDPIDPNDPNDESGTRWKANLSHSSSDLPLGLRGVIRYQNFSDFDFFRDFERDFNNISVRSLWSSGFVTGNWGLHSLNVLVDERETFISSGVVVTQRQLPEVEYRLRPTKLGKTPLYLDLLSSVNMFEVARGDQEASYSRADINPRLTLPIAPKPWLSLSIAAAAKTTFYEDSLTPAGTAFSGESLTRSVPSATAQVIGPSFSKIYDKKIGRFGKFKHVIEPRWSYLRVEEFDDQELVPRFDEVDSVQDFEVWGFSLVNRLLAKPAAEDSPEGAREILSFELSQAFSLRDDQPGQTSRDGARLTDEGPIRARLRFSPSSRTSFETRADYNTLFGDFSEASLLGSSRFGQHAVSLSWALRKDPEREQTTSHQLRLGSGFQLVRNRLRLDSSLSYDLSTNLLQQQRHVFSYTSQCYGVRFEWRELSRLFSDPLIPVQTQTDVRLSISLKNVGTFLDMSGGSGDRFRQ